MAKGLNNVPRETVNAMNELEKQKQAYDEIVDKVKMLNLSIWATEQRLKNWEEPTKNSIILSELKARLESLLLTLIHMKGGENDGEI